MKVNLYKSAVFMKIIFFFIYLLEKKTLGGKKVSCDKDQCCQMLNLEIPKIPRLFSNIRKDLLGSFLYVLSAFFPHQIINNVIFLIIQI